MMISSVNTAPSAVCIEDLEIGKARIREIKDESDEPNIAEFAVKFLRRRAGLDIWAILCTRKPGQEGWHNDRMLANDLKTDQEGDALLRDLTKNVTWSMTWV